MWKICSQWPQVVRSETLNRTAFQATINFNRGTIASNSADNSTEGYASTLIQSDTLPCNETSENRTGQNVSECDTVNNSLDSISDKDRVVSPFRRSKAQRVEASIGFCRDN